MDREDERNIDRETVDAGNAEMHATTGGAAAAGAVTGGVIGLTGGPVGAAIGAVGGAIVGAAAERMMHSDDETEGARAGYGSDQDRNPLMEDRAEANASTTVSDEATIQRTHIDQPVNTINEPVNTINEPVNTINEPVKSTNVRQETGRISGGDDEESSRQKLA